MLNMSHIWQCLSKDPIFQESSIKCWCANCSLTKLESCFTPIYQEPAIASPSSWNRSISWWPHTVGWLGSQCLINPEIKRQNTHQALCVLLLCSWGMWNIRGQCSGGFAPKTNDMIKHFMVLITTQRKKIKRNMILFVVGAGENTVSGSDGHRQGGGVRAGLRRLQSLLQLYILWSGKSFEVSQ